ncbi:hypothetical protein [Streptomyces formicae]
MENTARDYTEPTHTRAEALPVYLAEPMPGHPLDIRRAAAPEAIPTVVEVRTLDGRTLYHYADAPTSAEAVPAAPAGNAVPAWAKTTALLLVASSTALALAAVALKFFAEAAMTLVAALVLLAKVAVVLAFIVALAAALVSRARRGGTQVAKATATATARGFRAKATATATAVAKR